MYQTLTKKMFILFFYISQKLKITIIIIYTLFNTRNFKRGIYKL